MDSRFPAAKGLASIFRRSLVDHGRGGAGAVGG